MADKDKGTKVLKLGANLLKADPQNARTIEAPALRGLGVSMETFGDLSGIVWNERSGHLVAGHQRMNRLKAAGADEWVRDGNAGTITHPKTKEVFTIRIVDWDPTTERMANLTANNPQIQGDFTEEAAAQLRTLEDEVMFQALALDGLQEDLDREIKKAEEERNEGLTDPDDVCATVESTSKLGDLWILGGHRLLCGDSTKTADVAKLLDGQKAALLATDPPYGVDYSDTKARVDGTGVATAQARFGDIENDELTGAKLGVFLAAALQAARPHLIENHPVYLWHAASADGIATSREALQAAGYLIHRQIIWIKPTFVIGRMGMYHGQHEPCFYGWPRGNQPPWYGPRNQSTTWQIGRDDGKAVHPTQKPVAIFEVPMENHTRKGEVCYEPFSGSGSQLIAGERLGRRVMAMELSPRWVDVAVARWEAFTGKKGVRHPAAEASAKPTKPGKAGLPQPTP